METFTVLVTGAFTSGKTEFIRSLSEIDIVSTERGVMLSERSKFDVAFDLGRLTLDDNHVIYFFGTPGARWVNIELYREGFEQDFGIIMMVDSSKPETFREARDILNREIIPSSLPYVVAVNKQDRLEAWDVEAVRIALQIPPGVPVLPCSAKNKETTKPVLIALFELWSQWEDSPNERETPAPG